jgi:hypothetical protein
MSEIKWEPKREWWLKGKDFMVQVKHHTTLDDDRVKNLWNVYVFVYPKHPHFKDFIGVNMWQDACTILPMHAGPTYYRPHFDEKHEVTAHQVGCDYDHLHDDHFTRYLPDEHYPNGEVFQDALQLFEWMKNKSEVPV